MLKKKGIPFYVIIEENDGMVNPRKGRLHNQTITYKDRLWDYSPAALRYYPTVWNRLGFSRGQYGCHYVNGKTRLPFIPDKEGFRSETPELAHKHKKNDIVGSISDSARKTGQMDPMMKYLLFGGMGLVALVIVAFILVAYWLTGGSLDLVGKAK